MPNQSPYYIIVGPTASGKTAKAVALARSIDAEIISADSRQVFRGMDIGSGKDIEEYGDVPYHLIDIRPAGYKYNLYEFLKDEREARNIIRQHGKTPLLCGGTGLYVESVIRGTMLPEVPPDTALRESLKDKSMEQLGAILASMTTLHNVSDLDTRQRAIRAIEIQTFYLYHPEVYEEVKNPQPLTNMVLVGLDIDRDTRRRRITARLKQRIADGMVDEVKALLDSGVDPQALINYGLEYKFITQYLLGQRSLEQTISLLEIAIHQFAKRQMTWFRGMETRGIHINWIDYSLSDDDFVAEVLKITPHNA